MRLSRHEQINYVLRTDPTVLQHEPNRKNKDKKRRARNQGNVFSQTRKFYRASNLAIRVSNRKKKNESGNS